MCEGGKITKFERLHQAAQATWKGGNVDPAVARQTKSCLKRGTLYGYGFHGLPRGTA
jgi:hypothetical protein